jgi:hypothetical protein
MSDVTRLLTAAQAGDSETATELRPLVYDELRKLAAARLAGEKPGHGVAADRPGSRGVPGPGRTGRRASLGLPRTAARLVSLRYYAGPSVEEAGEALGLSRPTAGTAGRRHASAGCGSSTRSTSIWTRRRSSAPSPAWRAE